MEKIFFKSAQPICPEKREKDVNLLFNRTEITNGGSYANAVGLELIARSVSPATKYFMTLHQDIAPCKRGWLTYLLSKLNDSVKAAGVRMDNARVKEGILHVLGYVVDFQTFKDLNLDFFPDLPGYDVGDKAIVKLRESGYSVFATPNSLWDKSLIETIPSDSPFRCVQFDRSFDDYGEIFFLHLGRGVEKSRGTHNKPEKSIESWVKFINTNLLNNTSKQNESRVSMYDLTNKLNKDLSYSIRRYYVDEFFLNNIGIFHEDTTVLDMGGKKQHKRGLFNIEKYNFSVKYANISQETSPDYHCDITNIPVEDNSYDGVIISEVLEHVPEPKKVLQEAYRLLKHGGTALICSPFNFHVHGDPCDYGRYTEHYFRENLTDIGFRDIVIVKQGLFFSVLANMIKLWAYELSKEERPASSFKRKLFHMFVLWFQQKAIEWEKDKYYRENWMFSGYTTGYGIIGTKRV